MSPTQPLSFVAQAEVSMESKPSTRSSEDSHQQDTRTARPRVFSYSGITDSRGKFLIYPKLYHYLAPFVAKRTRISRSAFLSEAELGRFGLCGGRDTEA